MQLVPELHPDASIEQRTQKAALVADIALRGYNHPEVRAFMDAYEAKYYPHRKSAVVARPTVLYEQTCGAR